MAFLRQIIIFLNDIPDHATSQSKSNPKSIPSRCEPPTTKLSIFKVIVCLHPQPGMVLASSHAFAVPDA